MTDMRTIPRSREILNKLIFDPNAITWEKPVALRVFSEKKVLEIYMSTIIDTGYANYDEIIIRVLGYNDAIINSALLAISEEMPEYGDEIRCDHTKWYDNLEKNEVAYRLEAISSYVCRILNKYGVTYVPFMEHRFEKPILSAFGINGILTVNDCQNSFDVGEDNQTMICVGLGEVGRIQCNLVRSSIDRQVMLR